MAGDQPRISLDIGSILATDTFHLHTVHLHSSPAYFTWAQFTCTVGYWLNTCHWHLSPVLHTVGKTWTQCSILNTILILNAQYLPLTAFTCIQLGILGQTQCSMSNTCHWQLIVLCDGVKNRIASILARPKDVIALWLVFYTIILHLIVFKHIFCFDQLYTAIYSWYGHVVVIGSKYCDTYSDIGLSENSKNGLPPNS